MLQAIEVDIDTQGDIRPLQSAVPLPTGRALLVFSRRVDEATLLAGPALEDWLRPEEDGAWAHLQKE